MIHDKDVAASDIGVSDVPPIKDKLTVNAMSGQSRRKRYRVVHTLAVFGFSANAWITGELIMQRFSKRKSAQYDATDNAHNDWRKALRHCSPDKLQFWPPPWSPVSIARDSPFFRITS